MNRERIIEMLERVAVYLASDTFFSMLTEEREALNEAIKIIRHINPRELARCLEVARKEKTQ